MDKKVIILLGMPGAGKSTLSKLISSKTDFIHIEYDAHLKYVKDYPKLIFDGFIEDTEDLEFVINEYNDYQITIINLNVDKSTCFENINKRGRSTVDIKNIELDYDFNYLLREHKLDIIQIDNYKLNFVRSTCNVDPILFNILLNLINGEERYNS